ncbi:MAG: heme-binding protein [Propionibacteriaceae bacterium]|jgi:uncharacterized protein GlcG (DUF336 family)|nr:heme-binding protein [Propionibacteriaceae bacterium]
MTQLTIAAARALTQTAEAKAAEIGITICTAFVDAGGNLVAFSKMDGTQLASSALAQAKAYSAVAFRRPSKDMFEVSQPGQSGYALQDVDPRFVFAGGGIPLFDGDALVGAIGISGGSADEDQACAEAAVKTFNNN